MILLHIRPLLVPVLLRNDQVNVADGFQQLLTLLKGKKALFILFVPIELVCLQSNDQIVPVLLCPSQEIDMSIMKQVKGAVSNNSFQSDSHSVL